MQRSDHFQPLVLHARVVTGHGGGPDKTIVTAPRYYRDFGFASQCLYLHPPGDAGFEVIRRRAVEQGTELVEVLDRGPLDVGVLVRCWRVCRRLKPAIWHGHDYKTNLLGLMLVRAGCPMQLVTTVHGWVKQTPRTPLYYRIDKWCLPRYRHVYCVSADQIEACRGLGIAGERLFLLDNGIDVSIFSRCRTTQQAREGWLRVGEGRLLIGAMGRLSAEKGFDRLIRVVAAKVADGAAIELVIAGDGDQRASLEHLIVDLGMTSRIRLVGFCEDVKRYYESLDLFVLSSLREGLPNVLLEAMSFGLPVVSTRVAGVPRLIDHGRNGWLVDCDDEVALSGAITALLEDRPLRDRLGVAGRRTVERRFSFAERARHQCLRYSELLHGSLGR